MHIYKNADYGDKDLQMYEMVVKDSDDIVYRHYYAYGEPWVEQALFMDDMKYNTPEEAIAAWERYCETRKEQ